MKKTSRKKLTLETTTLRTLLDAQLHTAQGGLPRRDVSVATCTSCLPTYNPSCGFSCGSMCA
jgi:hypothetical protein